ncbi:MAG TPA: hypothetical protein PLV72_03695 [Candidatus Magasanikbacteria bacterium]|nr:hypothetical protein [Candidatus Magasanikbacteria bacterium]
MKKYIFASALLGMTIILGGCATTAQKTDITNQKSLFRNSDEMASSTRRMMLGLPKGTMSDLTIGKKITIMGKTNSDGTILADRILIGEWKMPSFGTNSSTAPRPEGQTPPQAIGTRMNRPTGANDPASGRRIGARIGGGQSSTNGEILKIDDTNIVLKLTDGNSKIIFFSASTTINFIPTTTPPMPEKN